MEIEEKLKILADSAKYDASCSSSGSTRKGSNQGVGNVDVSGICHSFGADRKVHFSSQNIIEAISILRNEYHFNRIYSC